MSDMLPTRWNDTCKMQQGITSKAVTRTKVWKCKDYFYCPFCARGYDKAEYLHTHLLDQDTECFFRVGYEMTQEAVFELDVYLKAIKPE